MKEKRERDREGGIVMFVAPCDSWRNAAGDSGLCFVSRQSAEDNGDDV